jgi:prolipoprotein diacylglyceryl transferase
MSFAFIPSPSQGVWHLGVIPIRAYALCIIAGVIVAVWVGERRYRNIGGRPGMMMDVATWAVPFGLVGARIYHVVTDPELYFQPGRDWAGIFKIWDGGLGIPGAIALGALGAWIACRRAGVRLGPVAGAAAPGIVLAQAIGRWGNWFNQELYGRPSTLPWAVEISPVHRMPGFENIATYQPTFLYESIWDIGVALLVIWAMRRFRMTGDRGFALYAAAYGVGRFITESLRIDYANHFLGLRVNQWMAILIFAGGAVYLYQTRHKTGPDVLASPAPAAATVPSGAGTTGAEPVPPAEPLPAADPATVQDTAEAAGDAAAATAADTARDTARDTAADRAGDAAGDAPGDTAGDATGNAAGDAPGDGPGNTAEEDRGETEDAGARGEDIAH